MHYSLAGVCMEGSRAPHARQLLSFVGCKRVASFLASICIDSSWILKFGKDKNNFIKGRVVKNSARAVLTGQETLDQLNALEPDLKRPGYFKGYNSEYACVAPWLRENRNTPYSSPEIEVKSSGIQHYLA